MPNQRAKDKVYLGGYVHHDFHSTVTRLARQAGMKENRFGFLVQLVEESIDRRRRRTRNKRRPQSRH
jgi:hypothetical protein